MEHCPEDGLTYLLEYLSDISDRFRLEKLLCMDLG